MASGRTVSADQVSAFCAARADESRVSANQKGLNASKSHVDRLHRERHLAMAVMADSIAAHFADLPDDRAAPSEDVLRSARRLDPDAFVKRDAMVERLLAEGSDRSYAERAASATWGARIATALAAARRMEAETSSPCADVDGFAAGVAAVAAWHDQRADDAERAASAETASDRKARLGGRAERHRLYARHVRRDFAGVSAATGRPAAPAQDPDQRDLPLTETRTVPATSDGAQDEGARA